MRITDDQLDSLEHALGMIEDKDEPTCAMRYCPGATDDSLDFWRRAVDALPAMIAEIRERRAEGLASDDRRALNFTCIALSSTVERDSLAGYRDSVREALAVIERLLAQGERK